VQVGGFFLKVGPRILAAVIAVFRSEFKDWILVAVSARLVVLGQGYLWRIQEPGTRSYGQRNLGDCVYAPLWVEFGY
jgi:hypothetical protein